MSCSLGVQVQLATSQIAGLAGWAAVTCSPPVCAAGPGPGSRTSHSPGLSVVTVLTPPAELYDAATATFVSCTYAYSRPAPATAPLLALNVTVNGTNPGAPPLR